MADSVVDRPVPTASGAAAAAAPGAAPPGSPSARGRRRRGSARYTGAPLVLISVNLVLFVLFFIWPALIGLGYSFTNYTGVGSFQVVGLQNYQDLFGDSAFYAALTRTVIYTVAVVPLTYVLALTTAVMLVSPYTRGKPVARVIFFVPWLISPIVAGVIWRWLFGENFGLVNYVITSLGGHEIAWQSNANLSLGVVAVAEAWSYTAFNMLLFVAAIKNVPTSYYEAASLDGAGSWAKFRYITLPGIAPTSFIVVLLTTINSMKQYALIQALNNGGPGTSNNLIVQYIYTTGFQRAQIGYASAASFILMLILMAIALLQLSLNRRREA